ncbi:PAS domain S-box protein [bacterium]|nr:PAS domain S-box protein [bacterium]
MPTSSLGRLLVVDDEIELLNSLADKLAKQGYETVRFGAPQDALRALETQSFDLLLTDLMMPGMDGIALLRAARQLDPDLAAIVMTGQATVQTAVDALKTGAVDYVLKPFTISVILPALARALDARRLRLENIQLRETVAIYELCSAIAFTLDHKTLLNKVVDAAAQQCEAEEASIMLPTEAGDELRVAAVRGEGRGHLLGERVPVNLGIAGWVARHHEPVALAGEVADPRFVPVYPRPDIRRAISTPMIVGGRFVGVLNVHSTRRRRPFTIGQVKALNILANTGAAALENAELHLAIRRAEENYRSIFENASEGILRSSPEGKVQIANPALAQMLGYDSVEEFIAAVRDLGRQVYRRPEDRAALVRRLEEEGQVRDAEVEMVRKGGGRIWVSLNARAIRDAHGRTIRYDSTHADITHRKLAEQLSAVEHRVTKTLADGPALSEAVAQILPALGEGLERDWCAAWWIDPQTQTLRCADVWHAGTAAAAEFERFSRPLTLERGTGLPGRAWAAGELAWTSDLAAGSDSPRAGAAGAAGYRGALALPLLLDGTTLGVIEFFSREAREPEPALLRTLRAVGNQLGQFIAKKLAEEARALFRALIDRATDMIEVIDPGTGRFLDVNETACQVHGYTRAEYLALSVPDVDPFLEPRPWAELVDDRRRGGSQIFESAHRRKDGSVFPVEVSLNSVTVDREYLVAVVRDITERKRAQEALSSEQDRFAQVAAVVPGAVCSFRVAPDGTWSMPYASPGVEDICGLRPGEVTDAAELLARVHPDDVGRLRATRKEEGRAVSALRAEFRVLHPVKGEIWVDGRFAPTAEPDGGILWHGVLTDVTDRKRAEERLRYVVTSSPVVLFTLDITGGQIRGVSWISENVQDMLGFPPEAAADPGWWVGNIHPEDRDRVTAQTHADLFDRGHTNLEYRFRHRGGKYLWTRGDIRLIRDGGGRPVEAVGSWSDVTDLRQIEDQFRHAQKMQAVGKLAAGVAHDFNNLLTVINGYSDMLLESLPAGDPSRDLLAEIHHAGERSAGLTRQLLAFSRQQVLAPRALDLNAVVTDAEKMLRRVIGEDVRLATALDPRLGAIQADPGQVEQVLLNLAVNARDAMPTGGQLTIETRNVELDEEFVRSHTGARPGAHVLLAVSDTGCGMTDEVKARAFEPFFTTKEQGTGTGLGLATVYGIIQQSGGLVDVYSEIGVGTAFKVYFPRVEKGEGSSHVRLAARTPPPGTETLLLVEDESAVRTLTRHILVGCGYHVVDAADGAEAIRIAQSHTGRIDLLISDVVMPGIGGRRIAEHVAELHPGIRVLFVSGYTDDAVVRHGVLSERENFLQKPFSPVALATKVREVLGACSGA